MDLEIGSTVGDYQVIDVLGAGGMGKVYKVRNIISDRVEAMKVLLPDLSNAQDLADRFLREIKLQATLEHPNIAGLHTALRVGNQLFMVMELVEGVSLDLKLHEGPLAVAQAVDYTRQVLSALEYAHAHGVVHRDIKPANMMLTPSGVVKLLDFGIAKVSSDAKLTMTGATVGSLYYMSPEQIQGASTVDARSDIYSVGVSLYQMVTGKRPFDGNSQFAIMSAHLQTTPVPPVELDPALPKGLSDAILLAVARDPAGRFQSATAFRNALGSVAPAMAPSLQPAMPAATKTMMAAAPPMPAPAPAAGPVPAPASNQNRPMQAAQAQPAKNRRGLWMALGGLAAAAAVVALIQFGPWKGTKAAQQPAKPAVQESTAPPSTPPQTTAPAPPQTVEQPAAPADQKQPAPQAQPPARPAAGRAVPPKGPQPAPGQAQPQPAAIPQEAPGQAAAQAAEQRAAEQRAAEERRELQSARERYAGLGARSRGITSSLQSLQRSQAAQGLNLSSRFQEPADLMSSFMEGAASALSAGDAPAAKDLMDKAEIQIEKLERLLNR